MQQFKIGEWVVVNAGRLMCSGVVIDVTGSRGYPRYSVKCRHTVHVNVHPDNISK